MLNNITTNYEILRLSVASPDIANLTILAFFGLAAIGSMKPVAASRFLDESQTDELKGIGILLVILGHLWVHVSDNKPTIIMSGDAVALFLILSGFGLTRSLGRKPLVLKSFLLRRLKKVIVPYWFSTSLVLVLDFLVLSRTYDVSDMILTYAGINLSLALQNLDYVRWYITLILVWYCLFYIGNCAMRPAFTDLFLFVCAAAIFIADYYILHCNMYQLFSFPVGCLIGRYYEKIDRLFTNKNRYFIVSAVGGLCLFLFYKIILSQYLYGHAPFLICKGFNEISSILFSIALIFLVAGYHRKGYVSAAPAFVGLLSYELFLLHGCFLVKYNPIFGLSEGLYLPVSFILFFVFVLSISIIFKKAVQFRFASF